MLVDALPQGLKDALGPDALFWIGYLTNGKHLAWYSSIQFTIESALIGGILALILGLVAAAFRNSSFAPLSFLAGIYINVARGVPDVLFFLFFPLAFEQGLEWALSTQVCTAESMAGRAGQWPPCAAANITFSTTQYLILAGVSLGIVYGAFTANVIAGALRAVPAGQLEAGRAYGMTRWEVLRRIHIRQMWIYALPGLSNVWISMLKSTSLLSLLQITDFVSWAQRLGAANFSRAAGLVHDDWRWRYYFVILVFYILMTFVSEKVFARLMGRARRGIPVGAQELS